ncbi:hypothetical protein BH11MYX3_BH11MYX3_40490 [soil metagenome]
MRRAVVLILAGCAHPAPAERPDAPDVVPADQQRRFTIWLGGAQVGTATESEVWSHAGVIFRRTEALQFLRGDAPVALTTTIEIHASMQLVPTFVRWTELGFGSRHGEARRDAGGWHVTLDGARLTLPAAALPAELVPLVIRRDGQFTGAVFLPARGFVTGSGHITPATPSRLIARLALDAGPIVEATIDLGADGSPVRVVDGEGVIAMRATEAQATAPFPLVDLIAATSVPLTGTRIRGHRLALIGDLALPALPAQSAHAGDASLEIELSASLPGDLPAVPSGADRSGDITMLVAAVRSPISPDLRAGAPTPRDAASATAGDCTTFALAYAALATSARIPTRVVTGLRIDGDRLIRHRWAVSWTGRAWIAVDAAFGVAPAGGDLIGLAIHDADDAGLIAGEAALTQVRAAAWL